MNWDAIGAIGEIVGAVAVFITLVYLSLQIRQNAIQARVSTATSQRDMILHAYDPIFQGNNAVVFYNGLIDQQSLSIEEKILWAALMHRILGVCEISLYQRSHGALEPELLKKHMRELERILRSPGGSDFWKVEAPNYGVEFQTYVNSMLATTSAFPDEGAQLYREAGTDK